MSKNSKYLSVKGGVSSGQIAQKKAKPPEANYST